MELKNHNQEQGGRLVAFPASAICVRSKELRLDNLFELADGTLALADYKSEYKKEDKVKYLKYLNYLIGIANRYLREKRDCPLHDCHIHRGHQERAGGSGDMSSKCSGKTILRKKLLLSYQFLRWMM